jgi:hypothetical protein
LEIHHCIHCGTEAQSTWRFCRRCGTGLADLEQIERVAQCGNCATELAEVWRFCPNCGTSSDTATPRTGLSNDDVADLIAAPEGESTGFVTPTGDFDAIGFGDEAATIQDGPPAYPEPAFEEPQAAPIEPAAVIEPEVEAPPPAPIEPAALLEPEVETPPPAPIEPAALIEPEIADPLISKPSVAFEPEIPDYAEPSTADLVAEDPAPPLRGLDLSAEAPAPPLDPMATVAEIEARLAADRPPPPGDDFDDIAAPEIADDGPLPRDWDSSGEAVLEAKESTAVFEVHRESAADIATDSGLDEKPAVVIPPSRTADRPDIPTELPTPLGSPQKPSTEIPQPIEQQAKSSWSPTPPKAVEKPAGELPPTDRLFQDPGLLGQATQLALLVAAAVSVAMVVAHIVLNNRLTDYQETFESIPRVESVQSIIGTWLRYLLILTLLGAFVLTVAWARRVVANLAIFRKPVSEAALWMWAIPLVNILVVRQHFDNAWKGSDVLLKDDPEWKKSRGNWWTLGFTALALLTVAVLFYGSNFVNADNIEGSLDSNSYLMIGYALLAASLLCLVRSISGIMERQHNRARQFV